MNRNGGDVEGFRCEYCLHGKLSHVCGKPCVECAEDARGLECVEYIRPCPEWEHLFEA